MCSFVALIEEQKVAGTRRNPGGDGTEFVLACTEGSDFMSARIGRTRRRLAIVRLISTASSPQNASNWLRAVR